MKNLLLFFLLQILIIPVSFSQDKVNVIVNESNPIQFVSTSLLRDLFLKRTRNWPNGIPARFFDRADTAPERKTFFSRYIKKTPRQIDQHWIGQKLYSGDSAPTQVASDSMVASLVARFPGGISYVSGDFTGAKGVKVIEVRED